MTEHVVLLHGLARTRWSMELLARRLHKAGYAVHSIGYPSIRHGSATLLDRVAGSVSALGIPGDASLHFVGHSLGGVMARAYLAAYPRTSSGRVVMLAPPNGGSEWVDLFREGPLLPAVLGPVVLELGTDPSSFPKSLPAPGYELGVVAASGGWNLLGRFVLPGPNDGTVSVESTRLSSAADHVVVRGSHTFLMNQSDVQGHTLHFLRHGRFRLHSS